MALDALEDISPAVALELCVLVLRPQEWIHRRVEHVSYLDHNTIRRRITVDFDVPSFTTETGSLYLPVAQFAKRKLVNFDIKDADGHALTMLTAEQNGRLSAALLLSLMTARANDQVDCLTEDYIPKLVTAVTDKQKRLAWDRIFQPGTRAGRRLESERGLIALATDLLNNFILYLPASHSEAGTRRLVKLAFDAPRPAIDVSGLRARLGWHDAEDSFHVPLAGYCTSYHFELEAPSEMEITKGAFTGKREGHQISDVVSSPTSRAHFNLSRLDRRDGLVVIRMRARSRSLVGGAALFATMNVVILIFVLLRLHTFSHDNHADAVVPALIAIPGILIGYITRPSEHAVVTNFLAALRGVALVSGLTSFAAAFVLFAGFSEKALRITLGGLIATAAASSLALLASWLTRRA